jgi:hypothetical protein
VPVRSWPEVWRRGLVSTIRTTKLYGRGKDRGDEIGEATDIVLVDRARRTYERVPFSKVPSTGGATGTARNVLTRLMKWPFPSDDFISDYG